MNDNEINFCKNLSTPTRVGVNRNIVAMLLISID